MSEFFRLYFIHDAMYDVVCTHALSVCIRLDSTPAGTQLKILLPPLRQSALECRHNNSLSLSFDPNFRERRERSCFERCCCCISQAIQYRSGPTYNKRSTKCSLYPHAEKQLGRLLFSSFSFYKGVLASALVSQLLSFIGLRRNREKEGKI